MRVWKGDYKKPFGFFAVPPFEESHKKNNFFSPFYIGDKTNNGSKQLALSNDGLLHHIMTIIMVVIIAFKT